MRLTEVVPIQANGYQRKMLWQYQHAVRCMVWDLLKKLRCGYAKRPDSFSTLAKCLAKLQEHLDSLYRHRTYPPNKPEDYPCWSSIMDTADVSLRGCLHERYNRGEENALLAEELPYLSAPHDARKRPKHMELSKLMIAGRYLPQKKLSNTCLEMPKAMGGTYEFRSDNKLIRKPAKLLGTVLHYSCMHTCSYREGENIIQATVCYI